jgi:hypothetical protein
VNGYRNGRRLWLSPAIVCGTLCPLVILIWILLIGRVGFDYNDLGWIRQNHATLNDAYVSVMTDRLSFADRVMLLYYEIPKASQTPTSWTARPFTPDPALTAEGVRLVESAQLADQPRIIELARAGGGSYWRVHRLFVAPWLLNLAFSALLIASIVWLIIFAIHRRRARRMMARGRLGLCPKCEYGLGGVEVDRCPECGGDLKAIERSAQIALRRGWFFRV